VTLLVECRDADSTNIALSGTDDPRGAGDEPTGPGPADLDGSLLQVDGDSEFTAEFELACQARGLPLSVLPRQSAQTERTGR